MISLVEAVFLVMEELGVELGGRPRDGLTLMGMARYADPDKQKITHDANEFLRKELATGAIRGTCVEPGRIRSISPEEWQAGYFIDFPRDRMVSPQGRREAHFLPLEGVSVCEKAILEKLAVREVVTAPPRRRRGRKPVHTPRVLAAMRADLQKGYDLEGATEEELVARYGASRDICRKARNAMSEIVGN